MSKEIIFNLSKNQLINSNSKKEFLEKSYYLDDGIDKCLIKNQKIYFFFNKTLNFSKKNFLNKKVKRLINRFKAIDNKIETKIIFENNIKTKGIKNSFLKLQKSNQIERVSDGLFSIKGNLLKKHLKPFKEEVRANSLVNGLQDKDPRKKSFKYGFITFTISFT